MCGIVGLFLKDKALEPQLGALLTDMLETMTDRGPDSAGIAIYGAGQGGTAKMTVQSGRPEADFASLAEDLSAALKTDVTVRAVDTHAVLHLPADLTGARAPRWPICAPAARDERRRTHRDLKEVGLPKDVVARFDLATMSGSHGIGHTRMATESAVTTHGAHPYSTGADQCLVHNGSLSNHNNLRRKLRAAGMRIDSENDTEVGAAYLSWRMREGASLGAALDSALTDLDGFFTFVVGTRDGFGVVRDPIACKPAVMAETDRYVAFGSEYRALVGLPDIEAARVWEPEPATVYFWSH